MGNNSVPKFIFRLSRFPIYRGSVLGRFYCTYLTWWKEESNCSILEVTWVQKFLVKVLSRPKCNLVPSDLVHLKVSLQSCTNKIVFVAPKARCISKLYLPTRHCLSGPWGPPHPPNFFWVPLNKVLNNVLGDKTLWKTMSVLPFIFPPATTPSGALSL